MKLASLLSLVLTVSGATLASAQAPGETGHRRPTAARGATAVVRALDANQDGEISLREIHNAVASLRLLDTDADGTISFAELHPGFAGDADAAGNRVARQDPVLRALDADDNGELSPFEIHAAKGRLLALDANADGKLVRDETRPLPAE
ncbi:MAG: EF-hand domain-containing protein [Opitutaceae bacterium]|nr:EF-hand domain-containing protein [Opitutaceae bacterium]